MRHFNVLIDYDNARFVKDRGPADVASNISLLLKGISESLIQLYPQCEGLRCRLYGGWIAVDGQTTHQAGWVLSEISKHRGRIGRVRVSISVATSIISRSDIILLGTYRDRVQKMVDGMISVDLLDLSRLDDGGLVIVSDDDDFIPSIISGSCNRDKKKPLIVLRRRKKIGSAVNDLALIDCNALVAVY